jgi:hypothetical protein
MSDQKYAIVYSASAGSKFPAVDHYLSGFESFCYGSRILGRFSNNPSCALPLSYNRACQYRDFLHKECPVPYTRLDKFGNRVNVLHVIPYPVKPDKEVTGDA